MSNDNASCNLKASPGRGVRLRLTRWLVALVALAGLIFVVFAPGRAWQGEPYSTAHMAGFFALAVAHAAIYASSTRWLRSDVSTIAYFGAQAVLLAALAVVSHNVFVLLCLSVAWGAEAVTVLGSRSGARRWVGTTALLFALTHALIDGPRQALSFVLVLTSVWLVVHVVRLAARTVSDRRITTLVNELGEAHAELARHAEQAEALALVGERQRLARDLHDTLSQGLVGLTLQLEAVDSHLGRDAAREAREIVRQALSRARETLRATRHAIRDLRELEAPGNLARLIECEVERLRTASGVSCRVDVRGVDALSSPLVDVAMHVVREALTNVGRYAQASEVDVRVSCDDTELLIAVQDDGRGFSSSAVDPRAGHYGLVGLRERLEACGGRLRLESAPGGPGTRLSVTLPLEEPT